MYGFSGFFYHFGGWGSASSRVCDPTVDAWQSVSAFHYLAGPNDSHVLVEWSLVE